VDEEVSSPVKESVEVVSDVERSRLPEGKEGE